MAAEAAWRSLVENPKGEACPVPASSATRHEALIVASLHVNALIGSTQTRWS